MSQDPRESEVETSCSEEYLQRSDDNDLDYSEPDSKGDEWDNFISELHMEGVDETPNRDEIEDDYSDEHEYFRDLTPDPRHSEVEDSISFLSEEDFYDNPNWICTLEDEDDEKDG